MNWAQQQRMNFIAGRLSAVGFINRAELQLEFQISTASASHDLQTFLKLYPGTMAYDSSLKRYAAKEIA